MPIVCLLCMQAFQLGSSSDDRVLILPLPSIDMDPDSLHKFLSLQRFSSLAHFAGHVLHSHADLSTYSLAASLHALEYFSGPAQRRLALANVLFGAGEATAGSCRDAQLAAVVDNLLQRGEKAAALALELLCLSALSADWPTVVSRLVQGCCAPSAADAAAALEPPYGGNCMSRLPQHLDGEKRLSEARQRMSHAALGKRSRKQLETGVELDKPAGCASEQLSEGGMRAAEERPGSKRSRPGARDMHRCSPSGRSEPGEAATAGEAASQKALLQLERVLSCTTDTRSPMDTDSACSSARKMQTAAMAVHPGLMAEIARKSLRVCQAYLSLLLQPPEGCLGTAAGGILHMLRLGGKPAELTMLSLQHCCSAMGVSEIE